jgi:hypothetical protein
MASIRWPDGKAFITIHGGILQHETATAIRFLL